MPPTEDDLRALGSRVRQRRELLGLTIEQAAKRAGFGSLNTWVNLEHGRPVRGMNRARAEQVLKWAPGSYQAVLDGGEPTIVVDTTRLSPELQRLAEVLDDAPPDVRARIEAMIAAAMDVAELGRPADRPTA